MLALTLVLGIAGRLMFTPAASWQPRPAASSMRVAEFVVPRAGDDLEDGDVIVYYFGGQGGSVEANVTRWIGQMQQPDGRASADVAHRDSRTVNGMKLSIVDVSGTFVAEMRPGSAEHFNKPGFRMRAAVVETDAGPYFIKLTGPERTVRAATADFDRFLDGLQFEK